MTHFGHAEFLQIEHVRNGASSLEDSPHNRQVLGAGPCADRRIPVTEIFVMDISY